MSADAQLEPLADALAALTPAPQHPALQYLVEALRQRYPACAQAVLFYGSCLRSGDPYDGLVDLYLIVDNYRCANRSRAGALWNRLLPPNVFYAEFPHGDNIVRCKYALLTTADFLRGTSTAWFQSYLWGRFSQPTAIAWARDADTRAQLARGMAQAVVTLLQRALPGVPAEGSAVSLWREALALSYATELRPESRQRARELSEHNADYYQRVTATAAPLLGSGFSFSPEAGYRCATGRLQRLANRAGWRLRTLQGKLLSLARLSKALFTFEGGLDYIAWKLERHSGQKVDIPERVRRYPLVFIWGEVWRLYRRGVFR